MAKKESTFLNMVLTLLLVTTVSALALGFVYNITKEPIELAKLQKLKEAINIVVPGAAQAQVSDEIIVPATDGSGDLIFYEVSKDGELMGTAIKTFTNRAFSGYMSVMVGFDPEGNIIDNNVLEHKETPGLGDKTAKSVSDWNEQFKGKNPGQTDLRVKKDGGDIDAITAATITARAYSDAIQRAYDTFMQFKGSKEDSAEEADETETDTINEE
jgi:Na+-translocating ferredoxin:NAD+ oxidoreductase subunit G